MHYRHLRRLPNAVQECSRRFKNVQEVSRLFKTIKECSRQFKTVQDDSRMFKNVQECSSMFKNVQKCSRNFKMGQELSKRPKKVSNVSIRFKKGLKQYKSMSRSCGCCRNFSSYWIVCSLIDKASEFWQRPWLRMAVSKNQSAQVK